jgi:hypothetical protein
VAISGGFSGSKLRRRGGKSAKLTRRVENQLKLLKNKEKPYFSRMGQQII